MQRSSFRMISLACLCAALVYGQASQPQTAPATLTVSGDIPSRLVLQAADLAKMPRETASIPEQDGTKVAYEGVPLREILKRAGAPVEKDLRGKALANYVLAKARDGYQVVFTLAEVAPEFANEPILVADKRDGKPLLGDQGPFRYGCWKLWKSSVSRNEGGRQSCRTRTRLWSGRAMARRCTRFEEPNRRSCLPSTSSLARRAGSAISGISPRVLLCPR